MNDIRRFPWGLHERGQIEEEGRTSVCKRDCLACWLSSGSKEKFCEISQQSESNRAIDQTNRKPTNHFPSSSSLLLHPLFICCCCWIGGHYSSPSFPFFFFSSLNQFLKRFLHWPYDACWFSFHWITATDCFLCWMDSSRRERGKRQLL